jgi:hypothetical protein
MATRKSRAVFRRTVHSQNSVEWELSIQNREESKDKEKKASRLLILVCLVTTVTAGLLWLALQSFPSLRIKIVFSILGLGFFAIAIVSSKTGFAPYKWGPVSRKEEGAFFYMIVFSEILAALFMFCFAWYLS